MMTISEVCPIASALRGSKSGTRSPTKPTPSCRRLRNRTGNDSPWFGVRSRRRLTVSRSHRIGDIGAIFTHAVHKRRESARQTGGLAMTIGPSAAYFCKEEIARGRV